MAYDLRGAGGEFRWNIRGWPHVLNLAQFGGWVPEGTQSQPEGYFHMEDWDGSYFGNAYQIVGTEDAADLAAGLRAVLDDIPDVDAVNWSKRAGDPLFDPVVVAEDVEGVVEAILQDMKIPLRYDNISVSDSIEYFSGTNKTKLVEFISYCEAGSFVLG